jgi:hypothetical protein
MPKPMACRRPRRRIDCAGIRYAAAVRSGDLGMIELDSDLQKLAQCAAVSPTFAAIAGTLRSADHLIQQRRQAESDTRAVGRFK